MHLPPCLEVRQQPHRDSLLDTPKKRSTKTPVYQRFSVFNRISLFTSVDKVVLEIHADTEIVLSVVGEKKDFRKENGNQFDQRFYNHKNELKMA